MSIEVNISQWINRIHGTFIDPSVQHGLERVTSDLTSVALQDAVAKLGIGPKEYLCVQEVSVPVTINLSRSTRSQSRQWGNSLCQQLMLNRRLRNRATIYYRSLVDVHIACAEGILHDDMSDLWAWQQVAVIDINNQEDFDQCLMQWSEQSCVRGVFQVAVWRHLLRSPLLPIVQLRFGKRHWRLHLDGIAAAMAVDSLPIETYVSQYLHNSPSNTPSAIQRLDRGTSEISVAENSLPALLRQSALLAELLHKPFEDKLSLVCMAILVAEPSLGKLPPPMWRARLRKICDSLKLLREAHYGGSFDDKASPITQASRSLENLPIQDQPKVHRERKMLMGFSTEESELTESHEVDSGQLLTPYGGIFWLINQLLQSPKLVDHLAAIGINAGHSQQWSWLWLVQNILPIPQCKSASMVFTGVKTVEEYAELFDAVPNSLQQQQIASIAAQLINLFLTQLGFLQDRDREQFTELMRCNASIYRDAAWVEITYAIDAVNIDVRRAGMDVDPGYVHWLGQVVRFNYA